MLGGKQIKRYNFTNYLNGDDLLSVKTIGLAANSLLPGAGVFHEQPVSYLFQNYLDALITSDSMPLLLPIQAPERAAQAIEKVDALILAGGQDISPELYHQEPHQALGQTYLPRDQWEIALMQAAIEAQNRFWEYAAVCN